MSDTLYIKAIGDWALEVLGVPFGGPFNGKDAQRQYFSKASKLHPDKYPTIPAVYYHGLDADGRPKGVPEYIGKAQFMEIRQDGAWYRVVLDKTSEYARRVWEAAKQGMARASSGSLAQLVRIARDGHIDEWPVAEMTLLDLSATERWRQPVNPYAVALPAMKAVYQQAGINLPDELGADDPAEADTGAALGNTEPEQPLNKLSVPVEIQMSEQIFTKTELEAAKAAGRAELEAELAAQKAREKELEAAKAQARQEAEAAWADEKEALEEAAVKASRLPDNDKAAPVVAKYGELWKYDNVDEGSLALGIGILDQAARSGQSRGGHSENMVKALAVRVAEHKDDDYIPVRMAMKAAGMPIKANELNQSTLANYGDDWIGVAYSSQLWEKIRQDTPIVGMIPTVVVPQGSESVTIPLQSTPPTFYKVAQASAQAANPGAITRTVTTSKMGTANQSLTVAKMGAATYYTGELEEDSLIPWLPELHSAIVQEGQEVLEHVVIDGDTATGATTNINDIGGTPGGTEAFLLFNGFRKLALVTNTANSRDGGTLAIGDFLETVKLMGLAGKNALQKDKVGFILDLWTHWKALELAEIKTRDVFSAPTIENGVLKNIYGYNVYSSAQMHRANADATYGLKANSAGKLDLDTASNNTLGAMLAVRWDQWRLGFKRRMTIETTRVPSADATEIVALMRVGMVYRDTDASAISYNLTL